MAGTNKEIYTQRATLELEHLRSRLEKSESDRTFIIQQGRALVSLVLVNQANLGIDQEEAHSLGRLGFLLDPEVELVLEHHFTLPFPDHSPVQIEQTEDLDEHVLRSNRWGNAEHAKEQIESWLNQGETVGLLAGKFRILNMGEVDALWKARKSVRHFIVAVASDSLCLVDKEFGESQFTPPLEWRMQQLIDLRFPDGSKIDYVFHNNADPFLLAGGQPISFLPFYFFHLPNYEEQSDYLLAQSTRLAELFGKLSQLDIWRLLAEVHQPTLQQKKSMKNFSYMLTSDPSIVENLEIRANIFQLFGGRVQWLPPQPYGNTISSSEIIRRWKLIPPYKILWHFCRQEQLSGEELFNLARVQALSRAIATSGNDQEKFSV